MDVQFFYQIIGKLSIRRWNKGKYILKFLYKDNSKLRPPSLLRPLLLVPECMDLINETRDLFTIKTSFDKYIIGDLISWTVIVFSGERCWKQSAYKSIPECILE